MPNSKKPCYKFFFKAHFGRVQFLYSSSAVQWRDYLLPDRIHRPVRFFIFARLVFSATPISFSLIFVSLRKLSLPLKFSWSVNSLSYLKSISPLKLFAGLTSSNVPPIRLIFSDSFVLSLYSMLSFFTFVLSDVAVASFSLVSGLSALSISMNVKSSAPSLSLISSIVDFLFPVSTFRATFDSASNFSTVHPSSFRGSALSSNFLKWSACSFDAARNQHKCRKKISTQSALFSWKL